MKTGNIQANHNNLTICTVVAFCLPGLLTVKLNVYTNEYEKVSAGIRMVGWSRGKLTFLLSRSSKQSLGNLSPLIDSS